VVTKSMPVRASWERVVPLHFVGSLSKICNASSKEEGLARAFNGSRPSGPPSRST
jgi:hypothetical protein